ncbi:hypothetical protein [Patiriisocius marinus]|uniref:hypothetical protein n=1 Tax=Patiriisocius marinus TaxID=1397112 RepID=UPI00232D12F2|nr:hypothetical protein [Patiriisocius marinus]
MNTQKYISLLTNPQSVKTEDLSALTSIIDTYPYFQSARALWLKGLKNENSFRYNDALKVTAAHTTNRDILFEYITSKSFSQNEIARKIIQHDEATNELEVTIAEDVSNTISLELDMQMKAELKKAEAILDPTLFEKKKQEVTQIIDASETLKTEKKTSELEIQKISALPNAEIEESKEEEEEALKEVLEIDKPLDFKKEDTHSFSEWLKLTSAQPIIRESNVTENDETINAERERKFDLIEKFITEKPKLSPKVQISPQKNLAEPFTKSSDSLMTETLAKVYVQQKNYKKAITAYKILILKYPEKSGFFADQIRAIEKLSDK